MTIVTLVGVSIARAIGDLGTNARIPNAEAAYIAGKLTAPSHPHLCKDAVQMVSKLISMLSVSVATSISFNALAVNAPPSQLPQIAQPYLDELRKPEYSVARCMISPVLSSDAVTVAITGDRVLSAGDTIVAIGGEQIDVNEKNPVRALLIKHSGNETVQIQLRRADKELTVSEKCTDAKPIYDLLLEAAYAASKNDAATCANKMNDARQMHALYASQMNLYFQCANAAGKFASAADLARAYYEIGREVIIENAWSSDALGRVRGAILTAVDALNKPNLSPLLADDLKAQYDQALAAKSQPATASANTNR